MSGQTPQAGARRPGRPPSVTRDEVVEAAVRVATREGLDHFTMGQLARELGVAQMTAYYHVANRQELVTLIVDELLGRVEIPDASSGSWEHRLKALQASVREHLSCMQGIPTGITITGSAASNRLVDGVFAILRDAGFDDHTAVLAYGSLFTYMVGQLDLDLAAQRAATTTEDHRFAELVEPSARNDQPSTDEFFDFGFELLLTGLRVMLSATASSAGAGERETIS